VKPPSSLGAWGTALMLVAAATAPSSWADDMLYYVDGDRVVFTNTPSRDDARPVPGLADRVQLARTHLPATPWDRYIDQLGRRDSIDPDLIKAVAMVESGFDPKAVSPKGAMGLMQLMPATAAQYGVGDPLDPHESLAAGSRHLRDLLERFDGSVTLALAAYNAGSGAVQRYGGVPRYPETMDYVRKVQRKLGRDGEVRSAPVASPRDEVEIAVQVNEDGTVRLEN